MWTVYLMYSLVGAVAGLLGGLLGIGGGLIIVPMLVACFGWQGFSESCVMHTALGTSMASIMFTSVSSSLAHHRRGSVAWVVVRRAALGILCGTFLGTCFVAQVPTRMLKVVFVVFLVGVAVQMVLGGKPKPTRELPGRGGLFLGGSGVGLISSLVGIGGGTMSVPLMVWHNIPLKTAIGTSAALGFPIAVAGTVGYLYNGLGAPNRPDYAIGYVYLPALAGIALLSIATAPLGAMLAHALPVDKLKKVFAVLLAVIAVRMLLGALLAASPVGG